MNQPTNINNTAWETTVFRNAYNQDNVSITCPNVMSSQYVLATISTMATEAIHLFTHNLETLYYDNDILDAIEDFILQPDKPFFTLVVPPSINYQHPLFHILYDAASKNDHIDIRVLTKKVPVNNGFFVMDSHAYVVNMNPRLISNFGDTVVANKLVSYTNRILIPSSSSM